jgi:tellurite methyltransferase
MSVADREKWDRKYAAAAEAPSEPSAVLAGLNRYLPQSGSAVDLAGGAGRNAIWLAKRGLDVTIADISSVGLDIARRRAAEAGVELTTVVTDLELSQLPIGSFDLVLSVCYLRRPLLMQLGTLLATGGTAIVIQPTKQNLQRSDKPPADYLLNERELPRLLQDLDIVHYEEGWLADARHDAVAVARKK